MAEFLKKEPTKHKASCGLEGSNQYPSTATNTRISASAGTTTKDFHQKNHRMKNRQKKPAASAGAVAERGGGCGRGGSPRAEGAAKGTAPTGTEVDHFNIIQDVVQKRAAAASYEEEEEEVPGLSSQEEKEKSRMRTMVETTTTTTTNASPQQPGAYSGAPGQSLSRCDDVRFSCVGRTIPPEEKIISTTTSIIINEDEEQNLHQKKKKKHHFSTSSSIIGTNQHLSQAIPVDDEEEDGPINAAKAQPFDVEAAQKRKSQGIEKQKKQFVVMAMIVIGVVVTIIVGFVVAAASRNNNKNNNKSSQNQPSSSTALSPTTNSGGGGGPLDELFESLPQYTLDSLQRYDTPQWNAMIWLENHPQLPGMPLWRQQQLLALVTFYYAMGGGDGYWPSDIQQNWLQYDENECFWFSNEFGLLIQQHDTTTNHDDDDEEEGGHQQQHGQQQQQQQQQYYYREQTAYNITPCNERKEYQLLLLANLQLSSSTTSSSTTTTTFKPFIPPEIGMLTSLSILALPLNNVGNGGVLFLDDFLPTSHQEEVFNNLKNLRVLNLHSNSLGGTIPRGLGLLSDSMTRLSLNGNRFTGTIPVFLELGMMTHMTQLYLQTNMLGGPIPSGIGMLTKMIDLGINQNRLTGTLATELGDLTNMVTFYADNNELTGSIPSQLGRMTDIVGLSVSVNSFTGSIPTNLGHLTKMALLFAHSNSFTGSIPPEIVGRWTNMMNLQLGRNSLTGTIPAQMGMMTSMIWLLLNDNSLSGEIPKEFGTMTNMNFLSLQGNNLSGTIPLELEALAINGSLTTLTLTDNDLLWGTIPQGLCSLGMFDSHSGIGLSFDCSDRLCGCCWCQCSDDNNISAVVHGDC